MRRALLLLALLLAPLAALAQFDHRHAAWNALLAKHVKLAADGKSSRVDYKGFAADRAALQAYLKTLSAVTPAEFAGWNKAQQYAFLANAYNAFTVEKILTRYPNLKSIRDFGSVFGNPWKDKFFVLLGREQNLDGIEHETMRAPGAYDDPRVHVAVNCASIGCPMLGREAFGAERLEAQLEDLMRRFMSDATRNRVNPASGKLELSKIFDWYTVDFERGGKSFLGFAGFRSVAEVGNRYAEQLAANEADRARLRSGEVEVVFLDYDWRLNDVAR
jgi:hypothetical protein